MIFITQCDSPALWQTYLSDPASITMEGILIFNQHLLFLLTVIVLFVGWLLFYTICCLVNFIEVQKFRTKKLIKNTTSISTMNLELTNNKKLIIHSYKLFMQ